MVDDGDPNGLKAKPEEMLSDEQLNSQVELARKHFLEVAATEGVSSEIAIEAVRAYHDQLQVLADKRGNDRDFWFNTEVYNTYVKAAAINGEYQEMVGSAREDLDMLQ